MSVEPSREQINELERAVLTNQKRKSATTYVDVDALDRLLSAYKSLKQAAAVTTGAKE